MHGVRVAWLLITAGFLYVCGNYVAQCRYLTVGFCPPSVAGPGPSLLLYDSREVKTYCLPLPMPPPDKEMLEPKAPASNPKIGA